MFEKKKYFISVVIPVYKAEKSIEELYARLKISLSKISEKHEIIFVEDGGMDRSWDIILQLAEKDPLVKGVKLSRNFGQHYAVTAGLQFAKGDITVLMDCDLQDDPEDIVHLYNKYKEGYEIVFTKRIKRKHSFFRLISAKIYYFLFILFSDRKYDFDAGSLVMFSEKVRKEFLKIKDKDRLYIHLLIWLGYKNTYIQVKHNEKFEGVSTYSFSKLIHIAVQGWTSHSDKLLRYSIYLGFIFSSLAFLGILWVVFLYFLHGFQSGWASLVVLNLFSTGLILVGIGIAGIYIGKTFEQSKNNPLYIVDEKINLKDD